MNWSRRKKREQEREGGCGVVNRLKARLRNQALERASEHPQQEETLALQ